MDVQNYFINDYLAFPLIFIANLILFAFFNWLQFKKQLKTNTIFDIALMNGFGSLLIARILGIINVFGGYAQKGWSLTPMVEVDNNYVWTNSLPWSLLNVFDGNYLYSGFLLGIIFSLSLAFLYSNQKKSVFFLMDKVVLSFAGVLVINLIVIYLLKTLGLITWINVSQMTILGLSFDMWGMQILVILIFLLIVRIFHLVEKHGFVSMSFYLIFAAGIFLGNYLQVQFLNSSKIELDSIIALGFLGFGIIQYLQMRNREDKGVESPLRRTYVQSSEEQPLTRNYTQSYVGRNIKTGRKWGK
jgi:hypothetical protein